MGERREALTADDRVRRALAANQRLAALEEFVAAQVVASYAGKGAELEPDAARAGKRVAYPRVAADGVPRLRFHGVVGPDELRPGAFGVREPDGTSAEVPPEAIDLFVVPGLAFDPAGRRLGYGGGYYDELIAHLRRRGRGFFVGLAYDFQIVDRCPAGERDQPVDCVVTDERVVRPGGAS